MKANARVEKELAKYLFRVECNLYVGNATRRLFDGIIAAIESLIIDDNSVKLMYQNAKSPAGFELFEVTRDGIKKCDVLDEIFIVR
jgi:hypothetical protein